MKSIAQLLELSKNPYYTFTKEEREVLDDFLLQTLDTPLSAFQKKSLKKSTGKTNVTVRNVVKKVDTYATELV